MKEIILGLVAEIEAAIPELLSSDHEVCHEVARDLAEICDTARLWLAGRWLQNPPKPGHDPSSISQHDSIPLEAPF